MDLAIAGGFLFKTLDEIEDIDFIKSSNLKEYIRTLSIAVFSILFLDNTFLAWFFAVCVVPISYYLNQVDTPFWKSLAPLPYLAILLHIGQNIGGTESLVSTFILFILCALLCIIEAGLFPEEISLMKVIARVIIIIFLISFICFCNPFPSTINIACFSIGYFLASILIKLYMNSDNLIRPEEYEKFANYSVKGIKEEFPLLKEEYNQANLAVKEVFRKYMTLQLVYLSDLLTGSA